MPAAVPPASHLRKHAIPLAGGLGLRRRDSDGEVGWLPALQAATRHRREVAAILVSGGHGGPDLAGKQGDQHRAGRTSGGAGAA